MLHHPLPLWTHTHPQRRHHGRVCLRSCCACRRSDLPLLRHSACGSKMENNGQPNTTRPLNLKPKSMLYTASILHSPTPYTRAMQRRASQGTGAHGSRKPGGSMRGRWWTTTSTRTAYPGCTASPLRVARRDNGTNNEHSNNACSCHYEVGRATQHSPIFTRQLYF